MRCCQDSISVNSRLTDLIAAICRITIAKPMTIRATICILCLSGSVLAQEQLPEFVLQNGHSGEVNTLAFSPDGKILASGSGDNTIKLWEEATGKLLRTLEGHSFSVSTVAFSPDGMILASGSADNTIKLWEIASGKLLRTLKGHFDQVNVITFSPDGKTLASGSGDHIGIEGIGMSDDYTIKLWEMASGRLLRTLESHSNIVTTLAFSPDGKILASGSEDCTIKLWEAATGELHRTLEGHFDDVHAVAFSPSGTTLASGGADKTIKLWEIVSGRLLCTLKGHSDIISALAFSSDGKLLASGSNDETIRLWEIPSGELLWRFDHFSFVHTVTFMADDETLASGGSDSTIKLWRIASGRQIRTLTLEDPFDSVNAVAFSPDGKTLASGHWDTIRLWHLNSGRLLHTFQGHDFSVKAVAFSQDGMTLVSTSGDFTIKLWEMASGKMLSTHTIEGAVTFGAEMAFSPDGKILASENMDGNIKLWEVATGKLLTTLGWHFFVDALTFSLDGKTLASGVDIDTIKLWELSSGGLLRTMKCDSILVTALAFSPDCKTLAVGNRKDNTINLQELASERLYRTLKGHSNQVNAVAFSPDGKILASGSNDTSLRFWRTSDGAMLAAAYAVGKNDYIIYSPSGYFAASKNAERFAAWRIGNEVYTFDQYGEQLNRPDLIARILAGEEVPPPPIRLAVDLPPQLVWINPMPSTSMQQVEIVLRYKGTSGLGDLVFVHNGEPVEIKPPIGSREAEIRIPLQLTTYDNSLRVLAYDEKRLKSDWQRIDFQYESGQKGGRNVRETVERKPQLGEYGKKYAIVIGISDYKNLQKTAANENELVDLQFAHKDAQDFTAFLQDSTRSGGGWEIHRFINAEATAPQIDETLTRILTLANSRDLIFIFFSGHARSHPLRPGDVYLLTHEFEPAVSRSGYDYSLLIKLIAETNAEHVIAFIDACRSGTIGFGKGDKQPVVDAEAFGKRLEQIRENQVIFSSASGAQLSREDPNLQQSVFTHFLIKGLRGAAADEKFPEFIDLGELYKYVRENVSAHVQRQFKAAQLPILWEKSGAPDENFPVAIRPNTSAINKQ